MVDRPQLYLHEAMEKVLRDHANRPMSPVELDDEINGRHLYWQRDGGDVPPGQIGARTHNYSNRFQRVAGVYACGLIGYERMSANRLTVMASNPTPEGSPYSAEQDA